MIAKFDPAKFIYDCLSMTNGKSCAVKIDYVFKIQRDQIPSLLDMTLKLNLNPKSILKYLSGHYVPTELEDGFYFEEGCIEFANSGRVSLRSSECHKVFTDLNHLSTIVDFDEEIEVLVNKIRIVPADRILYHLMFKKHYPDLCNTDHLPKTKMYDYRDILSARMRSFRRKWLRLYVMTGHLNEKEFLELLTVTTKQMDSDPRLIDKQIEKFPLPNISDLIHG